MSSSTSSTLIHFLAQSRSALLQVPPLRSPPPGLTLVCGNPSCDLDSFVSAVVYAFFHSSFGTGSRSLTGSGSELQPSNIHVPILNLPTTSSRELWRLRPEFGTALRLAVHGTKQRDDEKEVEGKDTEKEFLQNLVTLDDIRSSPDSAFHDTFTEPSSSGDIQQEKKQPVILVDHNAPAFSIPSLSLRDVCFKLGIAGCIDHHIDEAIVPQAASPRMIETGIGSCTTLVVKYLRHQGFWDQLVSTSSTEQQIVQGSKTAARELATLSLSAILVDTANLTAEGKVSALDREMVAFLENIVTGSQPNRTLSDNRSDPDSTVWDRQTFYDRIAQTKANSLSLLTLPEIFARDYKAWSESATADSSRSSSNRQEKLLKLGISSIVQPITWLISHNRKDSSPPSSSAAAGLVNAALDFARQEGLDIFVLMTSSNVSATMGGGDAEGGFKRELCIIPITDQEDRKVNDHDQHEKTGQEEDEIATKTTTIKKNRTTPTSINTVQIFAHLAGTELALQKWTTSPDFLTELAKRGHDLNGSQIWTQMDVTKSRKQVAPLLREAMRRALEQDESSS